MAHARAHEFRQGSRFVGLYVFFVSALLSVHAVLRDYESPARSAITLLRSTISIQ